MLVLITLTKELGAPLAQLEEQIDKLPIGSCRWVIVAPTSADQVLAALARCSNSKQGCQINILEDSGSGIYSALNLAIDSLDSTDSYLIVNPQDKLLVENLSCFLESQYMDSLIYFAPQVGASSAAKLGFLPPWMKVWLLGSTSFASGHATCFICPKRLHECLGYYSTKYDIASDVEFFYRLTLHKGFAISYIPKALAEFDRGGVSSLQRKKAEAEVIAIHKDYFGALLAQFQRLRFAISRAKKKRV